MEKIKETIKKHENTSIIIFIFFMIIGFCTNIYLCSGDEIWNFQNIYKMLNGYKLYTDANVIITPLFYIISYIILNIFGQNLLVFRLYNIIIMLLMYFYIYKVLRKLCKSQLTSFVGFIIIMLQTIYLCRGGANYNTLSITFVLIGVYLNLNWIENNEKHNIIQGIIMFLVFSTKQNIGVFYILGITIYYLIKEKKIKNILKQLITFSILLVLMLTIFYYFNILKDFINYAVLGIGEFAKENIGGHIFNLIQIICLTIFIVIFTIILIVKGKIEQKDRDKIVLLSIMSMLLMLVGFPIYNEYHKMLGNIFLFIAIIYFLDYMLFSNFKFSNKIKKYIKIFLGVIIAINIYISIINFWGWINNSINKDYFDNNHPFHGSFLKKEDIEEFEEVTKFVKDSDKNVIILSEEAALYMIPLKRNNGSMDLPFLGNIGKNGEETIIKQINKLENIRILIKSDENNLFWQESLRINEYIKKNLVYKGEVEKFGIYE